MTSGTRSVERRDAPESGRPAPHVVALPPEQAAPAVAVPRARMSLRRNVLWTLAGNGVYGGCQWAMLIVIAKLGTPEMVGQFALAFAVTAPVIMAANLNLRGVQATDAREAYGFGDYLALRLLSLSLAVALLVTLAVVVYPGATGIAIVTVAAAKSAESLSDVYFGFMQRHERMSLISRSHMVKGLSSLAGLAAGLRFGRSLTWAVVGVAGAWIAVLVLYDIPQANRLARAVHGGPLRARWRWPALRTLSRMALPLGFAALLSSLLTNIPRLFVERLLGARELGFFAAAGYLMIIGARFMTALGESASPRLASYHASGEGRRFRRLLLRMIGLVSGVGAVALAVVALLGRPLLAALYRPEYATQAYVLLVLILAAVMGYAAVLLQYAMTALRALRIQPLILAASAIVSALACAVLVPRHGNMGAAVAMCCGAAVQVAGNAWATRVALRDLRSAA
ncbi:lipopolysaccharide biosynthesis protein [Anaeromyxobacter soli]|uniref:lipopolysaccharide biosynthesis protein n=1 Tax=Anaeromyxobacter soli TaxID=2922725 RepID=UPI001FAF8A6D|nr:lipopolysaccharide biosynthesis protein [Anaeromyxobacter sp. SG29]